MKVPLGKLLIFDEDELKEALENGDITREDFDLAYNEADKIMNGMARDVAYLSNISYRDLDFFRNQWINTD